MLLALCEPVELVLSQTLCEPGTPTQAVYFPIEGFISLVALNEGAAALEVGMVGREGMLGAQLALGVDTSPLRALVQGAGQAWCIGGPRSVPSWRKAPRCSACCSATCTC